MTCSQGLMEEGLWWVSEGCHVLGRGGGGGAQRGSVNTFFPWTGLGGLISQRS